MSHKRLAVLSVLIISIFLFIIQNQGPVTMWLLFWQVGLAGYWWVILLVSLGFVLGFFTSWFYLVRPKAKQLEEVEKGEAPT